MGERPEDVFLVGCPRIDLIREVMEQDRNGLDPDLFAEGVGGTFDLNRPFVMVSQHPVTTEYGEGERQITETLLAVQDVGLPVIVFWPNADAGSEDIARGMRKFREHRNDSRMHFFKNLPAETYIRLMMRTACLVGNSSSAIREGAFIGVPSVNIGTRQQSRQRGINVVDVPHDRNVIMAAVHHQIRHGPYQSDPIYGDGKAGLRIAEVLSTANVKVQKGLAY
jgi:UDP-hydrolysing UDP-N-acetyl-D-glucosamine 2-epimerase